MTRSKLLPLVVLTCAVAMPAAAQTADESAVRAALAHYLMGHATGQGAHHAMVFHDVANLYWVDSTGLKTRTGAAYIAGSSGSPAADEPQRRRWIESVDVTGTAAMAKVILDYPTTRFTDYFTLLKVNGEWKIINKIFHREMKPAANE